MEKPLHSCRRHGVKKKNNSGLFDPSFIDGGTACAIQKTPGTGLKITTDITLFPKIRKNFYSRFCRMVCEGVKNIYDLRMCDFSDLMNPRRVQFLKCQNRKRGARLKL
jgi:hypothetical protein